MDTERLYRVACSFIKHPQHQDRLLEEFLINGGDVNNHFQKTTLLVNASRHGNIECVRRLLDHGADVDDTDYNRCTPLYVAASHGHSDVVRLLIESGADLERVNKYRQQPLLSAVVNNHRRCAKLLIQAGACVNVAKANTMKHSVSLVSYALFGKGDYDLAKMIILAGALPEHIRSPLDLILLKDCNICRPVIELMLHAGFKLNCSTYIRYMTIQETALGLEMTDTEKEIVQFITQFNSQVLGLQQLCRTMIRMTLSKSMVKLHLKAKIDRLPVPLPIKDYLEINHIHSDVS